MNGAFFSPKEKSNLYLASSLYDSIEDKNLKQLSTLLKIKHADPNVYIPSIGTTPIHAAVKDKSETFSVEAIKLILQHGGNPNVQTKEGITPLHLSITKQNIDVLKLLLNNGGDPFVLDTNGRSCFHYALENKYHNIVNILYDYCKVSQTKEEESNYEMSLERVILDDGHMIAEYTPDVRECICIKDDENVKQELELIFKKSVSNHSSNYHSNDSWKSIFTYVTQAKRQSNNLDTMEAKLKNVSDNAISLHNIDNELSHSLISCDNSMNNSQLLKTDEESHSVSDFDNLLYRLRNNEVLASLSSENDFQGNGKATSNGSKINPHCIYSIDQHLTMYNKGMLDKRIVIDEEYKYSDNEEKVTLIERRLCTPAQGEIFSDNTSFYSCKPDMWYPLPNSKDKLDPPPMLLRQRLIEHGQNPGPITTETYGVYLKRLKKLSGDNQKYIRKCTVRTANSASKPKDEICEGFSKLKIRTRNNDTCRKELLLLDITQRISEYQQLEEEMQCEFIRPDPNRRWREGTSKNSFNYLLLDPRITKDLPRRACQLTEHEKWETFLSAIFYVGKGKRSRPYAHLYDAFHTWTSRSKVPEMSSKCKRIVDIWNEGQGVLALHVFQNTIPVEAYTREALLIETLGLSSLANCKHGEYYGPANLWPSNKKRKLGKSLLYKAMQIFCFEGERQLFPENI